MNYKRILLLASIFGLLAVILGAFGAHKLKDLLTDQQLASYKTGISYHFYHVLALLFMGILVKSSPNSRYFIWSSICFITGILLFSGSIYLLSCREVIGLTNLKWLGPITPIGGIFFIFGWAFLGVGAFKNSES